jgi:hypothetical protein
LTGVVIDSTMSVSTSEESLLDVIKNIVVDCLFKSPKDYLVHNRGDVGSWVWKATMETLEKNTLTLFVKV